MSKARRPIPNYEGLYEITDTGQVYSTPRKGSKGGLKADYTDNSGYLRVGLCKGGSQKTHLVHQLVASAFLGENTGGLFVCHKDGNPSNNSASNLYYGTRSDNAKDAVDHGTHNFLAGNFKGKRVKGENCPWSKITEEVVSYIRLMKGEKSSRELAKELSISQSSVSAIWTGRSWRHAA